MLDYAALLKQLEEAKMLLFADNQHAVSEIHTLFEQIASDPLLYAKLRSASEGSSLAQWQGALNQVIPVVLDDRPYTVCSVDGSQIYPDKHQGTGCFLINTGLVHITYASDHTKNRVVLRNRPQLFVDGTLENDFIVSTELVNCRRQEWEFKQMLEYVPTIVEQCAEKQQLFLFDGSLIFWHLDSKDVQLKHTFLTCYLMLLHQLYELKVPLAGYISLPKAKEFIALMRAALELKLISSEDPTLFDPFIDTTIANFFLQPATRTTVFKNNTPISREYPDHLRPHFFYIHVGYEIARIEIPGYIAIDEQAVDSIARLVLDQANKGRGYPVAIAEAHEQAVIKGADRELFYNLIYKLGNEYNHKFVLSQKSLKKRGIGI